MIPTASTQTPKARCGFLSRTISNQADFEPAAETLLTIGPGSIIYRDIPPVASAAGRKAAFGRLSHFMR
jgi:hypothetical protein